MSRPARLATLAVAGLVLLSGVLPASPASAPAVGTTTQSPSIPAPGAPATPSLAAAAFDRIRNVVVVTIDDLDTALFEATPQLAALRDEGLTFTNAVVPDSLCCPSRTSYLRGQYVHNHRVISNAKVLQGGWEEFRSRELHLDNLATWLTSAGVRTAKFGKFLNGYPSRNEWRYVPPGWDTWVVADERGYRGYNYRLTQSGRHARSFGSRASDFLLNQITIQAKRFIGESTDRPFYLDFAPFETHSPYASAPGRTRRAVSEDLEPTPDLMAFVPSADDPEFIRSGPVPDLPTLTSEWRKRLEAAAEAGYAIDELRRTLRREGLADSTLLIVTSDNGFHLGQHRLGTGKRTAYRHDTVVPLVMIGPGIPAGQEVWAMVSTIDLAPTIAELMGATAPEWVDGRSLLPLMRGRVPAWWRDAVLIEEKGAAPAGDPDFQKTVPPAWVAMRTQRWLYVVYDTGEVQVFDQLTDPYEVRNRASSIPPAVRERLSTQLQRLVACVGPTCRIADTWP